MRRLKRAIEVSLLVVSSMAMPLEAQLPLPWEILGAPPEGALIPNAPLTATLITEQTGPDGATKMTQPVTGLYRDSAGRSRIEAHSFSSPHEVVYVRIIDPVAGFRYELHPLAKWAVRAPWAWPVPPMPPGAVPSPPIVEPPAVVGVVYTNLIMDGSIAGLGQADGHFKTAWELLPPQAIEGIRAEGLRIVTTIEAGAIRNDDELVIEHVVWASRQLGISVFDSLTDPRIGRRVRHLADVHPGEPNPALFTIPDDYVVR